MQVEHAVLDDARAVAGIHVDTWRVAYTAILPAEYLASLSIDKHEAMWRKCITAGEPELLVARQEGIVHGWLSFGACRDEGASKSEGEIWALYVSPTSWSTGTGRLLWLRAKELMLQRGFATCSLWVFPQNERAIRFYRAAGFVADSAAPLKTFELGGQQLQEARYACRFDDG